MKKRHLLFLALALVLVVSLVAGCTPAAPAPAATQAPAAQPTAAMAQPTAAMAQPTAAMAQPTQAAAAGEPTFPKPGPTDLVWSSGPQGGSWLTVSAAIAELYQKNVPGSIVTIEPGGGTTNMKLTESGDADLGMTNSNQHLDAINGVAPFETKFENTYALANLYVQYHQMLVLADSGIESPADLVGKRWVPAQPGQTTYEVNRAVLDIYGLTFEDLDAAGTQTVLTGNQGQANDMLKDEQVDGVFWATAAPSPGIVDVALARDVKLVNIDDAKMAEFVAKYPAYGAVTIPANTYKGQTEPVQTVGWYTTIVINGDTPDDVAYWLAKSIWDGRDDLVSVASMLSWITEDTIANNLDMEIHPGAKKFYEEIGAKMKQ